MEKIMEATSKSVLTYTSKIITLWTVFLLGSLFHTQLALMPLFHGMEVTESHAHDFASVNFIFWFMFFFFLIPLVAIVTATFSQSKQFRNFHFWLTVVYSILNFLHLVIDAMISVPRYQILLMGFLFVVGLLLNLVSYQWKKESLVTVPIEKSKFKH
jgi:hypothetical protein